MKIIMSTTAPGSVDGIRVATYEAGTEYDLTATSGERELAVAFVGAGLAAETGAAPADVELSAAQLKAALTERGIEFKSNASKADLKAMLDAAPAAEHPAE
jgi:hypothetical protein